MSISAQENSLTARIARWALACAVRHWPEENRAWGLALAAEIDEMASAFETVRWSLGGIMLFTRAVLSSVWAWMNLPAGGSLPGGADGPEGPSLLPKRSRVFTAAVLAAATLLLILPEGREAIRTVRASWQGYQQSDSDERALERLAARAEKEKDAGTLAFVALSTTEAKRAAALMDRAVSLDPEFLWIYGARNYWPNHEPPREEWFARLQAADPNNAVPYLLEAYAQAGPRVKNHYQHGSPKDADFELLETDSKWMALMESALAAPRYDSYFQRHYQLTRILWNREKDLSPVIVVSGLSSHAIPNLLNLRIFSQVKILEAQKARTAGDFKRAESLLHEVDAFGMRMANGSETRIERLIGQSLSRSADKELAVLYSSSGKTEDEQKVMRRIEQIDESFQTLRAGYDPTARGRAQAFRKEAILVQGFGTLTLFAGLAALAGILLLELWPRKIRNEKTIWRRATCWAADYAPAALLVASGAFLVSFLPFQRAFAEYRASNYVPLDGESLMDAMLGLIEIPDYVVRNADTPVTFWTCVTVALVALLLFVLARGFYRMRRAAQIPA
jgi:hypothetical protein